MSLRSSCSVVLVAEALSLSVVVVVMRGASFAGLLSTGFGCDAVGGSVVIDRCCSYLGWVLVGVGVVSSWGSWVRDRVGTS